MDYGLIESGVVTNVAVWETDPGAPWVALPEEVVVAIGWSYDGSVFTPPVVPDPAPRTLLTQAEWIESWTAAEWRQLKRAASGALSPSPVPDNVSNKLDQLLDSIRLTNSFDVQSEKANQFYGYLVAQGFITQARADELQSGI